MVSETERYLFDLNGYLVIKHALSGREVERLNEVVDSFGIDDPCNAISDIPSARSYPALLAQHVAFRDLIDQPSVMPYLRAWVGGIDFKTASTFRLDHAYFIFTDAGASAHQLHLGGTPYMHAASYHAQNGAIFSALTVVSYVLNEIPPGQGGFACIPGSHKANFPCPSQFVDWSDPSAAVSPAVEPGDAIIFTEALTHGAFPWTAPHRRRALFYKYAPMHMAWMRPRWPDELLDLCTEEQRALLQPPQVEDSAEFFVPVAKTDRAG